MSLLPVLCEAEAERWIAGRSRTEIDEGARAAVRPIVEQVRARGAPEEARANLEAFHRSQRREEARLEVRRGVTVWREFRPIGRVGVYVPGGRADYPSSVLMAGVPARLAGCPEIVVCAPPGPDGRPPRSVMAAAKLLVYGIVDIDMPAGPSEIVALADETANPRWVAADLISQAEHAGDALAVCVTVDAGSNHVLPTARAARAFDGLSVDDFGEWIQVQTLTREGLASLAPAITTLARWEGFEGHARAVEVRLREDA